MRKKQKEIVWKFEPFLSEKVLREWDKWIRKMKLGM